MDISVGRLSIERPTGRFCAGSDTVFEQETRRVCSILFINEF